ncbi:hypothetical protein GCM10009651_23650 [Microbacterium natoriense]
MILNATPEEGLEAQIRAKLIDSGWTADKVSATESASKDFATTTVYYVDDADELAAIGLANLIGGADVQKSDFYASMNETGGKQLTVVIGLDRSSSAPATTEETPAP